MSTEDSNTNDSNKFCYYFTKKLILKNPNKKIVLVNLSIYYPWKNRTSAYNNNKLKISAPICNDDFDLPDGSYSISDLQDYFEYLIKKHETIADNSHIPIYVNKFKNCVSTEQDIDENKNDESVPKL